MRVVCDNSKCIGCLTCVVACLDQHYEENQDQAVSGRRMKKISCEEGPLVQYVTESCHHCEDAPCMAVCPVHALSKDENGFVITDHSICIGCMKCKKACPYEIPQLDKERKVMGKCDGCAQRVAAGLLPACVKACPGRALRLEA